MSHQSNATTSADSRYLDARDWATLVAALWLQPKFTAAFEYDPVNALLQGQRMNPPWVSFEQPYVFDLDNPCGRRDLLIKVPTSPGYDVNELNDACFGLINVVPITAFNVCGVDQ
jgi:hypothetical protein